MWNFFAGFVLRIVLIETSWNVKEERPVLRQSLLHSINRNIVECKEQDAYNSRQDHTSINRNIVECKEGRDIRGLTIEIVLIETSWNVKPEVFPSTVQNRSPY